MRSYLFSKLGEECKTSSFHRVTLGGCRVSQSNSLFKGRYVLYYVFNGNTYDEQASPATWNLNDKQIYLIYKT